MINSTNLESELLELQKEILEMIFISKYILH